MYPLSFCTYDPETFELKSVISQNCEYVNDMAYDYSTGTLYAIGMNLLYTIDMVTGEFTALGGLNSTLGFCGLAITTWGEMYAIEFGSANLYRVYPETGMLVCVGNTGFDRPNFIQSATYDHDTDTLYWAAYNYMGGILYSIDISTGEGTLIGSLADGTELTGMHTHPEGTTPPEPVMVEGIEISSTEIELMVEGRTQQLYARCLPLGNIYLLDRMIEFTSDNEEIATVDEFGLVSAISAGDTIITATSVQGGFSVQCSVHVISLADAPSYLNTAGNVEGGTLNFVTEGEYAWLPAHKDGRLCIESNTHGETMAESIIRVDLGALTGGSLVEFDYMLDWDPRNTGFVSVLLSNGAFDELFQFITPWTHVTIPIPVSGSYTLSFMHVQFESSEQFAYIDDFRVTLAPVAALESVELFPETHAALVGDMGFGWFESQIIPNNADPNDLFWSSSDENVATVDSSGYICALSEGETTITLGNSDGSISDSSVLMVFNEVPVAGSFMDMDYSRELVIGEPYTFRMGLGSSERIIRPDCLANPDDWQEETWANGFSLNIEDGQSIEFNGISDISSHYAFIYDTEFNLLAQYAAIDFENPTTSYIKFIPEVGGTYYIVIAIFDGYTYNPGNVSVEISEYNPIHIESIELNDGNLELGLGRYKELTYTLSPEPNDFPMVSFASSNPEIVEVDAQTGRLHGLAFGTAQITVTTVDGGHQDSITVTVVEIPTLYYDGLLYGFNCYDSMGEFERGFMSFDPHNAGELSYLSSFDVDIYAAEYYDGLIYAFTYWEDPITFNSGYDYMTIDPINFDIQFITSIDYLDMCYELAYDYTSDTLYGICNIMGERKLCKVEPETGAISVIGSITLDPEDRMEVALTLAADDEGRLFVTSFNGMLYELDKETGASTFISDLSKPARFIQSMTYDHVKDVLYWAQYTSGEGNLLEINPDNGEVISINPIGLGGMEIAGMFVFYDEAALGDSNLDGVVNTGDVSYILRSFVGLGELNSAGNYVSDVNGDGSVNTGDAAMLLTMCLEF